jgi:hypothetical protein
MKTSSSSPYRKSRFSRALIRLKRIYNFWCSMLVYTPFTLCFVYSLWCFYAFSGTNLLTRCHSVSSCFLLFCVLEKLHGKYSQNWTKQKLKFLITWHEDGDQRRAGGGPRGSHTMWWHGQPSGRATRWCDRLVHLLTSPFHLFVPSIEKTLKAPNTFPENILQIATIIDARSGGSRSSSRHPAGEGNHNRRPSSSPCPPPEWCVSSLP